MSYRRRAVICYPIYALSCMLIAMASPVRAAVGVAAAAGQVATTGLPDTPGGYSSRHIVIKLTPGAQSRAIAKRKALGTAGKVANGTRPDSLPWMGDSFRGEAARWHASKMTPLVDWEFANPDLARKFGFDRLYVLHFPQGTDTPRAARRFRDQNEDVEVATTDAMGTVADTFPDDPEFDRLWGFHNTGSNTGAPGLRDSDIDAPEAWDIHTGAAGDITIAIIDSGIDPHPDLPNVIAGRNTDPTTPSSLTTDDCSHGTHVAGTAAGTGNNAIGVVGVSWGAKLMPVRVTTGFSPCGFFPSSLTAGIIWAADNGADVANISLQAGPLSADDEAAMQNAIDYARSLGMVVIAANGNHPALVDCTSLGGICNPARLRGTLAVGATTSTDLTAGFSNQGVETDVAAPGDKIYSTCLNGEIINCLTGYGYLNGTSMATPHVSGLAALLKSYSLANALDLSVADIEDIITVTAEESNNGLLGWDEEVGYGRINAHQALLSALVWPTILSSSPANGAIDARQHTDRLAQVEFGVSYIDMDFPAEVASELTIDDFTVLQKGGAFAPPVATAVGLFDADTVRVTLSEMMEPLSWTTVAHNTTGIVRVGFLPGDVNADQIVTRDDAVALAVHFLGTGDPLPEWSTDLDWSGATTTADFLTLVNLLHGADLHENATGTTLP